MKIDFSWKSIYSVGHSVLDGQHRELLRLCACARDCADGKLDDENFHKVINDLLQYALKHFEYEESLLAQCHYSELDEQKSNHFEFLEALTEFLEAAMFHRLERLQVADFVWRWWLTHVLVSDMKYRVLVKVTSNGIAQ